MDHNININAKVWRQRGPRKKEHFETYAPKNIPQNTSFLEVIDIFNEQLIAEDREPIIYSHDCREGICSMCSIYVNRHPRGPISAITTYQLHMRTFKDGDAIAVKPWRPAGFPITRDLTVDRLTYDKIIQAGGYVSVSTGGILDANLIPIPKHKADEAVDTASYIGCGACAATCKNGSTMLFTSVKVSQLAPLPQGHVEAHRRAEAMIARMNELGFGNCTSTHACEMEYPESVSVSYITRLDRQSLAAKLSDQPGRISRP